MTQQTKDLLRDIDEATLEAFDVATREEAKEQAGSRRDSYERSLEETRKIAGKPQAHELAEWIQEEIREKKRFPPAKDVRKRAAKICRDSGYEVSASDWIGA